VADRGGARLWRGRYHFAMATLQIRVKPNAREDSLARQDDGTWLAKIKAQPVDGKANAALIALVAKQMGVRKAQVSIRSGAGGRMKLVDVDGA
jgi:uncharacterized protein YggU (UPF0235/DUF167 family)